MRDKLLQGGMKRSVRSLLANSPDLVFQKARIFGRFHWHRDHIDYKKFSAGPCYAFDLRKKRIPIEIAERHQRDNKIKGRVGEGKIRAANCFKPQICDL